MLWVLITIVLKNNYISIESTEILAYNLLPASGIGSASAKQGTRAQGDATRRTRATRATRRRSAPRPAPRRSTQRPTRREARRYTLWTAIAPSSRQSSRW